MGTQYMHAFGGCRINSRTIRIVHTLLYRCMCQGHQNHHSSWSGFGRTNLLTVYIKLNSKLKLLSHNYVGYFNYLNSSYKCLLPLTYLYFSSCSLYVIP